MTTPTAPGAPVVTEEKVPEQQHQETRFEQTTEKPLEGHSLRNAVTGDTERQSSAGYAGSVLGGDFKTENAKAIRKLTLKLDVVILPFATLLYLAAYLDRGNMGNARLQGLEATVLDNSDEKYSLALAMFFISYIVLSIPGTLLAKAIVPSTSIATGAFIWSVAATCQAATQNPAGVYVCRFFIGVGEAMFGQAMALYFSYFYTRQQIAKRVSLFIGAGALSGAFGGLIAFGVSSITKSSIAQWRILFLIEGCPSVLLAICVFLFLPSRPQTTRYLNENERTLLMTILNADNQDEGHTGIDINGVKRAFLDWKTYVVSIMYSCMNLGLGSVGGFLPTIIKGLGYSSARAQLFTVPPYAVAFVFMILLAGFSDRQKTRGFPVAAVFCVGIVGWALLLGVNPIKSTESQLSARYFGCICVVTAGYSAIPLIIGWQSNNTGSQSQRAVSLGMLNTIGQCLSVLASYSFPSTEGPKYTKGIALNLAFQVLGLLLALSMTTYYRYENKKRDRVEGKPIPGQHLNVIEEHDLAPGFRYIA